MNQKEMAIGIAAVGLIGGLGFFLLKKDNEDAASNDESPKTRKNPRGNPGEERIKKLKKAKAVRGKAKKRIEQKKHDKDSERLALSTVRKAISSQREVPAVLWATARAVFLKDNKKQGSETIDEFIRRVFEDYAAEGIDPEEAVSRAFAIATKSVQDKGLVEPGTQRATKLGENWQRVYVRNIGEREYDKRFSEFEAILRLAKEG